MRNTIKRLQARSGSGFTLIELLVVIAILAILSGVVVFAVGKSTANADKAACQTERASLITAHKAAVTSNKMNAGNKETWADYLKSADVQYFNKPVAGSTTPADVDRDATKNTSVSDAAGKCPDIPASEFQA
jgi:prepilin-type N-terminal cleavage/methylation domain-containing protein